MQEMEPLEQDECPAYGYYNPSSRFEQLQESIEELISSQHRSSMCNNDDLPQEQPLMQLNRMLNLENGGIEQTPEAMEPPREVSVEEFKIDSDVELFDQSEQPLSLLEL